MIKKIYTINHPVLRAKAKPVPLEKITQKKFQNMVTNLIDTMLAKNGVGIAAPQINESWQVIVVHTKDGPLPLFNPQIVKASQETEIAEEGCLSVPHVYDRVARAKDVVLSTYDFQGEKLEFKASGFFARVLQHEIDHLSGILFIDKIVKKQ